MIHLCAALLSGLLLADVADDPAAQTWGYQDCDERTVAYPYPDDPGDGFPPGSCPPPPALRIECPDGSKLPAVDADASTWEKGYAHPPKYAIDEHMASRWSSLYTDDQWLLIDLGSEKSFRRLYLVWELAHGSQYAIATSRDKKTWKTIHTETAGDGFVDILDVAGKGRYIKIQGLKRAKVGTLPLYGYSLFDVTVCAKSASAAPTRKAKAAATPAAAGTPATAGAAGAKR